MKEILLTQNAMVFLMVLLYFHDRKKINKPAFHKLQVKQLYYHVIFQKDILLLS